MMMREHAVNVRLERLNILTSWSEPHLRSGTSRPQSSSVAQPCDSSAGKTKCGVRISANSYKRYSQTLEGFEGSYIQCRKRLEMRRERSMRRLLCILFSAAAIGQGT